MENYLTEIKNSSLRDNAYIYGEEIATNQLAGFLGYYAISVIKNVDDPHLFAAAASFTVWKVTGRALETIYIKMGASKAILSKVSLLNPVLSFFSAAITYTFLSTFTLKRQIGINVIILTGSLFAKYLNKNPAFNKEIEESFRKDNENRSLKKHAFNLIADISTEEAKNLLFFYSISIAKIFNNFSPLAAALSTTSFSSAKDLLSYTCIKIGCPSKAADIISSIFGIVVRAGVYSFVATFTIKGQLAVNAAFIITSLATKIFLQPQPQLTL